MINYCGFMNVKELATFTDGQRKIYKDRIKNIHDNYTEYLTTSVLLSKREDGSLHIIDGAHRVEVAKLMGIPKVPVIIFTGLTQQEEAKYFILHERSRKKISAQDLFAASINSGDETAIMIDRIVRANGYKVVEDSRRRSSFQTISAIKALERIVSKYGPDHLGKVLSFIGKTWVKDSTAIHTAFLEGVAKFLQKANASKSFDMEYCVEKFYTIITKQFLAKARNTDGNTAENLCSLMIEHYNHRLSKNKIAA